MEKDIAKFLYEMGQLKRVKRSGWWIAGVKDPESVAEHTFRTAVIAYLLAHLEGVDAGKAVLMALFHDMPETRTNDAHRIVRRYANWEDVDRKAVDEQSKRLPDEMAKEMVTLFEEFEKEGPRNRRAPAGGGRDRGGAVVRGDGRGCRGTVYVVPKRAGRELGSFTLGNWSFWLITFGISLMGLDLTMAGLQQGYALMSGVEWLDALVSIRPYWLVRTVAGISMDIGMSLLVYNLMRTVLAGRAAGRAGVARAPGATPEGARA